MRTITILATSLLLSLPSIALGRGTEIVTHDVGELLESLDIPESEDSIRMVATNPEETHVGFLFDDGKTVTVYLDAKKIYIGKTNSCSIEPYYFSMTDDGHLLYVPECGSLYLDGKQLSTGNSTLYNGTNSAIYDNGKVTYPYKDSVMRYDMRTKKASVLYRVKNDVIQFVRMRGGHVAYASQTAIYRDGVKLSKVEVSNPANFILSKSGDVYYFSEKGGHYTIYKNSSRYVTGTGKTAFILEDDEGTVWHVSFVEGKTPNDVRIALYKGKEKKNILPSNVANMEGWMAFSKGSYAVRISEKENPDGFVLLKDGKILGKDFLFQSPFKDYHGPFYVDGKVYMRNHQDYHWVASEDGKQILTDEFSQVWLILKNAQGNVSVYGTK